MFFVLPDGARLLVDAGDLGDPSRWKHKEIMPAVPSADKRPAEWIARYIEHFSKPLNKELYLDYAMITHFDTDHHGYRDSMNSKLLNALSANAIILPVWDLYHPHSNAMKRIIDNGVTEVFPAGMTEENLAKLDEKGLADVIRPAGHIVIRVFKGGKKYQIFVLNDRSLDYEIIYKSKVLPAVGNFLLVRQALNYRFSKV